MPFKGYLTVRVILRLSGVFIAFLPTMLAAPELSFNPVEATKIINDASLFRDLFLIVVPAAVLGLRGLMIVYMTALPGIDG
jgi:hypothetical protein